MNSRRQLACLLILFSTACTHALGSEGQRETVLLTARPTAAVFLHANGSDTSLVAPSTYRVTLADVQVWEGGNQGLVKDGMKVELRANQPKAMLEYDRIYLVLDRSGEVLYWERVINVACLPGGLVDPGQEDKYFQNPWARPDLKCRFLKTPPSPDN